MKKRLLVTTAALSLSVISLAPTSSLAAIENEINTQIKDKVPTQYGNEIARSTKLPSEVIDQYSRLIASNHTRELLDELMSKLNNSSGILGSEKGSKLTVKISDEKFNDIEAPRGLWFKGKTAIHNLSLDQQNSDPSLNISYNPSTKEFTIEKIKDQNPTGDLKLLANVRYAYQTWEWYTFFWVQLNDRIGNLPHFPQNVKFTNFALNNPISDGQYKIITSVNNKSTVGEDLKLRDNPHEQGFNFTYNEDKKAYVINRNKLSLKWNGSSNIENLQLAELKGTNPPDEFLWILEPAKEENTYYIKNKKNPDLVLDVHDYHPNDGTPIKLNKKHALDNPQSAAQKFKLEKQ